MLDLSDKDQLKRHLQKHGLFAKKAFGQNFLVDSEVLDQIVVAADLQPTDKVLEVGPGPGALSQRLAPKIQDLTAVEIDEDMIAPWKDLMKDFKNAQILQQDVLHYVPEETEYKLVANIPYYITSPILKHFLRNQRVLRPKIIVLMIQKEVAQRICDLKQPTLLSWEIRVFGEPEIVRIVPAAAFHPAPKVDSAVLKIRVFDQPLLSPDQMESFYQLLSWAYKQPRKTLYNNLCSAGKWKKEEVMELLQCAEIESGLRPHQLSLEDWVRLLATFSKGS